MPILAKAFLFLLGALIFGSPLSPRVSRGALAFGAGASSWPGRHAAAVFMVVATTMAMPPLLVWSIRRR